MAQTAEWNDFIAIFPPNESEMADSFGELMINDFGYSDYENFESSFLGGGIDAGLLQDVLNQSHPFVLSLSTWLGEIASTSGDWTDFSEQFSSKAEYYITFIVSEFSPSLTIEQFAELEINIRAASIYEIPGFWEQFLMSIGEYVNTLVNMLQITSQPSNQNVCEEGNATFSISASGSGTISYQWRKNGSNIGGATSSSLNISNVDSQDVGSYDCVVGISTGLNRTSQSASLTVKEKVEITNQPSSAEISVDGEHTFQVTASGDTPLSYQWRKDGVDISGATSNSLVLSNTVKSDTGNYDCVVSNSCGSEVSNSAVLIVGTLKLNSLMSNWSSYLQAVSFGYRNVIQEIWNYYTSEGVSYEQFTIKTAQAIQSDLESLTNDSPFFIEYANSLKEYANFYASGEGAFSEMSDLMLEEDQLHYNELISFLENEYTDFESFKTVEISQLAAQIYTEASAGSFFEKFASMMVAVRGVDIWNRLALHFFRVEDREIELLIENIRDVGGVNINSFRVFQEFTSEQIAETISDFGSEDSYRDFLAETLIQTAKLTYQNFGEGDQNADIWDQFIIAFPELKQPAIEFLRDEGDLDTVYQLSNMEVSGLRALFTIEFFNLFSNSYLNAIAKVAEKVSIQYRFIGQLVKNNAESTPLSSWQVHAIDLNDAEYGEYNLGTSNTNNKGYFEVYFWTYTELSSTYQLDFTLINPETGQEVEQSKNFDPNDPKTPVVFSIDVNVIVDSALLSLVESLDENIDLTDLSAYLSSNELDTLEDVRKFGGLATKGDLPAGTDTVAARLDSHANLELIKGEKEQNNYIAENSELIDNGFTSVRKISATSRHDFVKKAKVVFSKTGNTGQYSAGKAYEQAGGLMGFVKDKLTGGETNNFKDYETDPDIQAALRGLIEDPCQCDDCKSGVSPLAYLVDLINYTLRNVKVVEEDPESYSSLNLSDLQQMFKHPFADLPLECNSLNENVCQIRVCIEVLWTQLFNGTTITGSNDLTTADDLKNIRLRTYELLLTELGTSYEEMRKMRVAPLEERIKFASRIGIPEEKLNEFILDHSSTNDQINDVILEELFGYRDTTRNYKTVDQANALVETPKSKLEIYKENYLKEQFHNEDFPSRPYTEELGLPIIDPDIVSPDDFRNPDPNDNPFGLWQQRFDFLSYAANELSKHKKVLSTFPKSQKIIGKGIPPSETLPDNVDVIGADGVTVGLTPIKKEYQPNGETVYTVDEKPPSLLQSDSLLTIDGSTFEQGGLVIFDLSTDYEDEGIPSRKSIFSRMQETFTYNGTDYTPWEFPSGVNHEDYFDTFYSNLRNHQSYNTTVSAIMSAFSLEEDEFLRLYAFYEKNKIANGSDDAPMLTDEEWGEVIDILLVAIKRSLYDEWTNEESTLLSGEALRLGPKHFWQSVTSPLVGQSPFPIHDNYFLQSNAVPLIDPELVNKNELPDITAGSEGISLYNSRKSDIASAKSDIRSERASNESKSDNGFGDLMEYVYGTDLHNAIEDTNADLESNDPNVYYQAEQKIIYEYYLSVEQFTELIKVREKASEVDPANQPTDDEWEALYGDLLTPYKIINLYPGWLSHEASNFYASNNLTWKLRKATLPKWRANVKIRNKWKDELSFQSRQPIIDPYLINPVFIKDIGEGRTTLSSTNRALQLWDDRRDAMETVRTSTLTAIDGANLLDAINSKIETILLVTIDNFLLIKDQQEAGVNVRLRLAQLGLSFETFERLYNLRALAESQGDNAFTEAEKTDFANILTDIYKKQFFGEWNEEERIDNDLNATVPFALSVDYFREMPMQPIDFPPKVEEDDPRYLFDSREFKKWKNRLESRSDILQLNKEEIQRALKNTQKVVLVPTRDALIRHLAGEKSMTFEETQDYINRNLLISSEMECCSPTTRVTQAIEALQILLWGMYNQVILDEEVTENIELQAPDFENEWKWLGSYATWRAAMFVQLYPENLMLSELLPQKTSLMVESLEKLKSLQNDGSDESVKDIYISHFNKIEDYGNLIVKGTCILESKGKLIQRNDSFSESDLGGEIENESYFIIAQSSATSRYYIQELKKKKSTSIILESDWLSAPPDLTGEFKGLSTFKTNSQSIITIFTLNIVDETSILDCIIYDVNTNNWTINDSIKIPNKVKEIEVFVDQSDNPNISPTALIFGVQENGNRYYMKAYEFQVDNDPIEIDKISATCSLWNEMMDAYTDDSTWSYEKDGQNFYRLAPAAIKTPLYPKYFYYDHYLDEFILIAYIKEFTGLYYKSIDGFIYPEPEEFDNKWVKWILTGKQYVKRSSGVTNLTNPTATWKKYNFVKYGSNFDESSEILPILIDDSSEIKNILLEKKTAEINEFEEGRYYIANVPGQGMNMSIGFNPLSGIKPLYHLYNEMDDKYITGEFGQGLSLFKLKHKSGSFFKTIYEVDNNLFNIYSISKLELHRFNIGNLSNKIFHISELNLFFQNKSSQLEHIGSKKSVIRIVNEFFYDLPLFIARYHIKRKRFDEAKKYFSIVYDFEENVPIYYRIKDNISAIKIDDNWAESPLNPHDIAASREGTLKRSFYLQLIDYFISYANHEFSRDTVESIARARQLYYEAQDLIDLVQSNLPDCEITYDIPFDNGTETYIRNYWTRVKGDLLNVQTEAARQSLISQIDNRWNDIDGSTDMEKMIDIDQLIQSAIEANPSSLSLNSQVAQIEQKLDSATLLVAGNDSSGSSAKSIATKTGKKFESAILETTGFKETTIEATEIDMGFLENKGASMLEQEGREATFEELYTQDPVNPDTDGTYGEKSKKEPEKILQLNFRQHSDIKIGTPMFCVAHNPIVKAFELHVKMNLYKIHNCMNISGIQRSLSPFAAPTDSTTGVPFIGVDGFISTGGLPIQQASPYRYDFLIERSKELINISQNIESAFLTSLEKLDEETYSLIRAKQDIETAKATVKLQDLRIDEAEGGIKLAELQTGRAEIQVDGLSDMIASGLNEYEARMLGLYQQLLGFNIQAIVGGSMIQTSNLTFAAMNAAEGNPIEALTKSVGTAVATILGAAGIALQTANQINSAKAQKLINTSAIRAAQARREQEWNYQRSIALQDVKIGRQQEKLAQDRLRIVNQEKEISLLQQDHNEATLDFLLNGQFTNKALYEFMVDVLEKVYSYFLQEASAMAKLAKNQLAFERQKNIPDFIQGDYWVVNEENSHSANSNENAPDRKGITGSARLLQDIYRLDQYAQQTDDRKHRLTKTISLSTLAPYEFQQFKESGLITFATDMELFDRDYPGHYLRLIKKVDVSVIALVPPIDGVKASLSGLGLSRVVTGGPLFQEQSIRRNPETMTLSSANSDSGLVPLEQENKLLRPFEGSGVEMFWEFRMERGANPNIDYSSIADILITIEYEALNSFDYKARVVSRLNESDTYEAMLPISFRQNLPDQWFDLMNPDQTTSPFSVSFNIERDNFPINMADVVMNRILVYFPQKDDDRKLIKIASFSYADTEEAKLIDLVNDEAVNAEYRVSATGLPVDGKFTIALEDTIALRNMIEEEKLSDVLMVISFSGTTPKYNL
ncbi:MAG: hypothetical protein CMC96_14735 [Flavobacteriales bacterium]|nr:hypothetical protein [Flavobacteriales bacterium]|tara:strand:+ start:24243 stop:34820 length:10578 start_codon:yes stop_codon:yes gene_type:complete